MEDVMKKEEAREKGHVSISQEVFAAIAAIASSEIDGIFHREEGMKRYVDTEVEGENVKVTVRVTLIYGNSLYRVAKQIQTRVRTEVEQMTGLQVSKVNVDIQHLVTPEEQQLHKEEE